jgi:excisionase family DNA binding protein
MEKGETETPRQVTNYDQPLAEMGTIKSLLNECLFMLDHMSHQRKLEAYGQQFADSIEEVAKNICEAKPTNEQAKKRVFKKKTYLCPEGFEEKGYLTTDQLAKKLGVSKAHISVLCRDGLIGYHKIGKRYFFSPKNVKDYLECAEFDPGQ